MVTIFDLKQIDDETLLRETETRLSSFSTLRTLFDHEFIQNLVRRKHYFDNYLLWLLYSDSKYAILTLEGINKYLNLLRDSNALYHFREKLRHTSRRVFESYLTELEMAGYYKEKGYNIELEPKIPETKKNPDFKAEHDNLRVFFEVKNLFIEELLQMEKLDNQIQGLFDRMEEHYILGISYKLGVLRIKHLKALHNFVKRNLEELDRKDEANFPISVFFPEEKNALAEVKIFGRPKKLNYGYFAGIGPTAFGLPRGGINFRRKISGKISQLPRAEANVIVVEFGHLFYDEDDLLDALLGDLHLVVRTHVSKKDFSTRVVRTKDRIFAPRKNTRLSAVIHYKKKFINQAFLIKKTVIHNPFAVKRIKPSFFADKGVEQLVPIKKGDFYHFERIRN